MPKGHVRAHRLLAPHFNFTKFNVITIVRCPLTRTVSKKKKKKKQKDEEDRRKQKETHTRVENQRCVIKLGPDRYLRRASNWIYSPAGSNERRYSYQKYRSRFRRHSAATGAKLLGEVDWSDSRAIRGTITNNKYTSGEERKMQRLHATIHCVVRETHANWKLSPTTGTKLQKRFTTLWNFDVLELLTTSTVCRLTVNWWKWSEQCLFYKNE